jgi:hypothetical protein
MIRFIIRSPDYPSDLLDWFMIFMFDRFGIDRVSELDLRSERENVILQVIHKRRQQGIRRSR